MCHVGNPVRRVWDLKEEAKFKTHGPLRAEQRRLMSAVNMGIKCNTN